MSVITDNSQIHQYDVPYEFFVLKHSHLWNRIVRTRLSKILHSLAHLSFGYIIPSDVWRQAKSFNPDVVLTIAGSWSWTARLARQVAHRLDVPLVGSFMDWWYYNQIYTKWAAPRIEAEFRNLYKQCDLALCISEGMQSAMGTHSNSTVLYPIGSPQQVNDFDLSAIATGNKLTLAFCGNMSNWYGHMLEDLVLASQDFNDIQFRLFGANTNWSNDF
ncbi:MAG: glycosyltransferase, partial [Phormidesmis sp. RL_2_1]|nr:glycosyltransferase [Phormidesmis sp. RL_2_1]